MTTVSVRYMIDDVDAAIAFYTTYLGFSLESSASPAFAAITRGPLRLLLSGKTSSGARPLTAEVARLRAAGLRFRNDIVTGVGGSQILLDDPSGNPIELFQPA